MAEQRPWSITPRRVLVAFVTIIVVGVVISPATVPGSGGTLTTYASDPGGARGLFETSRRLGWPTARLLDRFEDSLDHNAIYAILRPPLPLTSHEVSAVLEAVRSGAGLLLVPGFGSAFLDSLGVKLGPVPPLGLTRVDSTAWDTLGGLSPSPRWPQAVLRTTDEAPDSVVVMLAVRGREIDTDSIYPVVLGIPLGRGRIVVMAHGALLSNVLLREDSNAVLPIRMLEWLAPGRRPTLVFAEYHQGHGQHASVMKTIRGELFHTPVGRAVLHLLIAAGVLLLAVGVRPSRAPCAHPKRAPLAARTCRGARPRLRTGQCDANGAPATPSRPPPTPSDRDPSLRVGRGVSLVAGGAPSIRGRRCRRAAAAAPGPSSARPL